MKCPQCGYECPPDFDFCPKCATPVQVTCPECGFRAPATFAFCPMCAAPLAGMAEEPSPPALDEAIQRLVPKEYAERLLATRGQVQAERRMVTILFSDVKGSTAMAETLDPEDVMEIMDGAFDVLIEPIYRYEGTLARLMGDAILAFFGAPIAHEDDPERACRAALEIVEGAQAYGERLRRERGIEGFNVRVGINTGLVVAGEVGSDLRVEYTAMGDAINLAQRMEAAAEPGTVLITEATHKLIAPLFETEALDSIQVKGRTEPVSVVRVLAAKAVAGKPRGIAGLESPLVGRQAEFAALQEALERLQGGVGGVVTLVGEAGIGKSRLVAEIRRVGAISRPTDGETAHESPLQWVEGRCLSYGSSIAYLLWLDVLRALLGVTLDDSPDIVRGRLQQQAEALCPERFDDVYPYLARLMSLRLEDDLASRLGDMAARDLKAHAFQAVQTLIDCAAKEQPLVLICEDLHWADPTSVELLQQVLALTERMPLLLLCVFRPVKDHGCWRFRELAAQTCAERHTDLMLEPLSPAESQALVANLLEIKDLPEVLRERILSRAEGNPFYVEEVIRSLIDRGAILQDQATGRWTATREIANIPIPDTLQGLLMARVDRLQEDTKRVLQMASVIGRIFLYRVLAVIAEEERRLDEHLLTLQYQEMIRERALIPELEYIFKHDLTRESAYSGLLKKQRRVFHRQVGEALEGLFPDRIEEQLGLLAHHWERAGDAEKAIHYLQRAGDQARLMYSHQEAIDYYERALASLKEESKHEQAARTLMKLGLTYHTAFEFRKSREAYEEGFALWRQAVAVEPTTVPAAPHALRVPRLEPQTLDPALCGEAWSEEVIEALFCGLVQETAEHSVVPDLATRWDILEAGRKYVFHLRQDARWSDGSPLTAHDFVYAWRRVLDPDIASPGASMLSAVKGARSFHCGEVAKVDLGVRAPDERTLVVELEQPSGCFLYQLAVSSTYPVPRRVVEMHGDSWTAVENLVSNGPFRLAEWRRGDSMILRRNPHYYGQFRGNLQMVELIPSFGQGTVLHMYDSADVDELRLSYYMSTEQRETARWRYASDCMAIPMACTVFAAFDTGRAPFNDIRVRQALVLATDREAHAGVGWGGYPIAATGGYVPPGIPGHSPGIALPYDEERARQLLAEAGYAGGRGFPDVRGLALPSAEAGCMDLRAQWQSKLGVDILWELVQWSEFVHRQHDEPPHISQAAYEADYPDPNNFFTEGFPWEFTRWEHKPCEEMLEAARHLMDQGQRLRLYREVERIVVREAPIMPLFYMRYQVLVKPWVKNYPGPWKDVIIEPH